ncbi:MAG: prepilin-type N-terminal cleavage/methylation domain-containing protein [bacterium]|nr:prepilin-type N-terminal cleavage/methylation domain-containing protein [bacterium]
MKAGIKKNRSAFTLLELAIVLILIGILIGIVVRGTQTGYTAKVNATVECYRINLYAIENYFNTYRRYPGDGDGDGKVESDAIPILRANGFDVKVENPFGGTFTILWRNFPSADSGNYIYSDKIPPNADSLIDSKIDDGNLDTGRYRRISNVSYLKF